MTEPDKSGFNFEFITLGGPIAFLLLLLTISLFQLKDSISYFPVALWMGIPLIGYSIVFVVNIINQQISCHKMDAGKALLGGIPSLITIWIGLAIASISYCRIPIASVFTPLVIGETVDIVVHPRNANTKRCCSPSITLEKVESMYPIIAGFNYGFYVMFAILFGFVFGNGISSIC
jgi:hypothetical protein